MAIKSGQLREKEDYQAYILEMLETENNYTIRKAIAFDAGYGMDPELLFDFLYATQKDAMLKLEKLYKEKTKQTVLNYINNEINKKTRCLLDVLKHGVEFDNGVSLTLMYRKPATSFNQKAEAQYNQNVLSVMEEVCHKEGERIDLVIFVNGIAIFTFELKCNTSGQNFEDAICQYKYERDYKTRLLKFKAGCLAHFAMDLNEVYMCTNLKGKSSFFLPFNKGRGTGINSGKGNPHNDDGINVSYMWEDILKKDTMLYLIDKIIFLQKESKKDSDTGKRVNKESLIFPRYHQFNAVRKVVADVSENGSLKNYLIEHSAGSGKTNTIAWLAHRLSSLHNADDKPVFDTVCIITDRIVVDRQLQNAVLSLEHKAGLIKVMDDTCKSSDLADALNGNTKIIVTTIHKFMYIHELVGKLKSKKFAVIIDEAHSSTAGTAMESVTHALSEVDDDKDKSMADLIEDEIKRCGKQDNVSMIAFTATPKPTTLQLFGSLNEQGKKVAFDLYSMKQAIEEGFIIDVLKNYVTYQTYFEINKAIEDDPELETIKAKRKIAKYIELHDTNIAQKVEIIIEHFKNRIMAELDNKAKAMVVTSSRQSAVKYRNEFESYITKHGYTGIRALVAFSGKITIDGKEYTETVMNSLSEEELPETFDGNNYQVLLVANKYQTGFDQPKLCAMYVDKKLRGVNAVQTLSRLNRICAPYNKKTFILDFKNEYADIQNSFAPFYTETVLAETITPSDIRAVEAQVDQYNFLDVDEIEPFNEYLYQDKRSAKDKAKMWSILDKSLKIINIFGEAEKMEIKATIKRFIRFYSFLIQATCFESLDLHKKYNYLTYLVKEIEVGGGGNDFDIADKITASNFLQKMTGEETSDIESNPEVSLPSANGNPMDEKIKKKLSEIIDEINAAYNKNFDVDVATKSAYQMRDLMLKNGHLKDSAKNNSLKDFRFAYFDAVQSALLEGYEQNQEFFTLLLDNDEKKRELMQVFLEDTYTNLRGGKKGSARLLKNQYLIV
ncbi:type I restriction endonuclease subunit R [Anaerorhabdus sp.]|uniref:type I restriction endonuclease subunit R n=1 Tax=Anaerorhabdus sp. TaxID=1872524 RepID=UPI002FC62D36